jgi:NitT/TauT family transport system substrate-binding protein
VFAALGVGLAAWRENSSPAAPPGPPEKLVIGVAAPLLFMPIVVAEEQGFLRDAGLDVTTKHFPSGKAALEALLRGEVEVATVADTPIVLASLQRRDFVVVGNFLSSDGDSKLLAHPASGIQSVADLRGHRIAVVAGTTAQFFLDVLLTDHGLRSADVVQVPLPAPEMAAALLNRRVDAVATFEPYLSEARKALGNTGLVLFDRGRCMSAASFVSFRDFPGQRKEALVRLLRGTGRAIDWMRSHRAEAIAIVARQRDIAPASLDALWDGYSASLELNQGYLISLEQQAQWAIRSGLAPAGVMPNYLDFIDWSALAAVKPEAVTIIH